MGTGKKFLGAPLSPYVMKQSTVTTMVDTGFAFWCTDTEMLVQPHTVCYMYNIHNEHITVCEAHIER